jgi:serine/threonine protein kinase/Tfp pilus assembly protein PilF
MGEVWRARDTRLFREVAVKVLTHDAAGDPDRMRRFELEARSASALNHPAILTVYDVGVEGGTPFLVTELLEGRSLRDVLSDGAVTPKRALKWTEDIARGLAATHEKGILHRDLKPENVFLTSDGRVKILDFGLAKLRESESGPDSQATLDARTEVGAVLGTLGYMAPEQVRGEPVDERADVFALGCVLFELLTGRPAFRRRTATETLGAMLTETPASPAGVEPRVAHLLSRALAKRKDERIPSARAFADELESFATADSSVPPRRSGALDSVAVLPFLNESGDADVDYLSEGVAESLLDALTRLPKLRVLARSTVMRLASRATEPIQVGLELGVSAVVTGRLRQRGEDLRIACELVRVADGVRLWGRSFERPLSELPAIRDEMGDELAEHLRPKTTRRAKSKPSKKTPVSTPAYQAYLRGRYSWNRWTPESMRAAVRQYDEALALDPTYAPAWAGLADAWATLGQTKTIAPSEAFPRSKAAALRALELDEQQPEAHASLGFLRRFWEWDWEGSERAFKRSLELAPSYATAHRWYGLLCSGLARHEQAIAEVRLALELDPLSLVLLTSVGDTYFYARRYDESVAFYRRAIDIDPEFLAGHSDLARALEFCGRTSEAVEEYERAIRMAGTSTADPSAGLANVLAVAGRAEESRSVLATLSKQRVERYVSPWALASIHARLGETQEALDWLERAYEEHDSTLVWLKVHPRLDALRAEPRFRTLLERMRL